MNNQLQDENIEPSFITLYFKNFIKYILPVLIFGVLFIFSEIIISKLFGVNVTIDEASNNAFSGIRGILISIIVLTIFIIYILYGGTTKI